MFFEKLKAVIDALDSVDSISIEDDFEALGLPDLCDILDSILDTEFLGSCVGYVLDFFGESLEVQFNYLS